MNRGAVLASFLFAGFSLAPLGSHVVADEQPLYDYSAQSSRVERQWEEKLRAIPSTDNLRVYMQRLSARPHNVGSPYDKDNAEWIAAKFKEFDLDTHLEQFDGGGIYHSIYDDFYWYTHFSDTDFVYGRALARTGGTAVLRLADADLLPFEFGNFADPVQTYVKELKTLSQKFQDDIRERNWEIEEGVFKATDDPRRPLVPPVIEAVPPHLNFAPLDNAADALVRSAGEYRKALEQANANGGTALASASLAEVNKMLIESQRRLTNAEGLPNRPWFKHQLYAPGYYTGYAVKTVPAVREAIEQKQWKQADDAIVVVARLLQEEAALVSAAAAKLGATTR